MRLGIETSRGLSLSEKEFDGFNVLKHAHVDNGNWYLVHKGDGVCWACTSPKAKEPVNIFRVHVEELRLETK